uniref:Neurotensin/neuromedin N n=1 Tax=Haplochromis burtoni TaxID=8153 RepID=A0A3Q2VQK4_HAPBU
MQTQLACMLLLCLTCGALCTDVDQEQRALEEELLSSLFTSKMKQNKQSAPYWRVSLANLCKMLSALTAEPGGEGQTIIFNLLSFAVWATFQITTLHTHMEKIYINLIKFVSVLCETYSLEYSEENSDAPLKRKSPYILKRQVGHITKTRRPYILKRSTFY